MIKSLLFLCASLFVASASAQKPINKHFNFQTREKKTSIAANSSMSIAKHVPLARGWFQNSTMQREPARLNGLAKTPGVTNNWFQYPASQSKCYVLSFSSLAESLRITDTEFSTNTKNQIAIEVPASYAGAVIDRIANIFYQTSNLTDAYVWVNDGLDTAPSEAAAATYYQAVPADSIKGLTSDGYLQMSYVTLKSPVTVGKNGCLIGFSFNCPATAANIVTTAGTGEQGGFDIWYPYNGQSGWDDSFYGFGVGNLAIAAHMDLSNVVINSMACNDVYETTYLQSDSKKTLPVSVTNEGYKDIESYSYVLTVDGAEQAEQTVNDTVKGGSTSYVYLPLTLTTEGEHYVMVNFTKVNGKANGAATTSKAGYVVVLNKSAKRVSVVEEATSTACGYCPRGTVGMDKVKQEMGDDVVVLSAHADYAEGVADPMTCEAYENFIYNYVSGFPTAFVNRAQDIDPYYGLGDNIVYNSKGDEVEMIKYGVTDAVKTIDAVCPSEATVALKASIDENRVITATADVNVSIDRESNPYTVVFVLSQDGMTGTDVTDDEGNTTVLWSQYNYYSQALIDFYLKYYNQDISTAYTDSDMDKYKNGKSVYAGEVYNNVVVDAWGYTYDRYDYTPLFGFTFDDEQVIAGEAMTMTQKLDISKNTVITDMEKLKLAALVVNANNGEIVNAAQIKLDMPATGIKNVATSKGAAQELARYNVAGARSNNAKGLNIVKFSDGTVKKIMVK